MSVKIDLNDTKILLALLENSRLPIQKIAKQTRLSREIVQYRMNKLEEAGIIKGYVTRINQAYFCQGIASVFLKLSNITKVRQEEIITYLKNNTSINWTSGLCGNYDLTLTILYDNPKDLSEKTIDITNFIGKNLIEQHLAIYIAEFKFDRSGLLKEKLNTPIPKIYKPVVFNAEKIELDEQDMIILSCLAENSRIKNVEIATKTSIDEDAIRLRIKKLESKQVINGYTIIFDPTILGYESYYLLISIDNLSKELINKINYYVHSNKNIIFGVQTTGKHNLILNVMTKNRDEFAEILSDLRSQFPDINNCEINFGMKEYKEVFVPMKNI